MVSDVGSAPPVEEFTSLVETDPEGFDVTGCRGEELIAETDI
jgi:hypothetical protein